MAVGEVANADGGRRALRDDEPRLDLRHPRQIVDLFLARAAESIATFGAHRVPIFVAREGDLDLGSLHESSVARRWLIGKMGVAHRAIMANRTCGTCFDPRIARVRCRLRFAPIATRSRRLVVERLRRGGPSAESEEGNQGEERTGHEADTSVRGVCDEAAERAPCCEREGIRGRENGELE